MEEKTIKYQNFKRAVLVFFALPVIALISQQLWEYSYDKPLNGAFQKVKDPVPLTAENWFEGKYQKRMSKYLDKKIGFHPSMVRINNAMEYYLFDKSPTFHLRVGADGWLYAKEYIHELEGSNFMGMDTINYRAQLLEKFKNHLEAQGKKMMVVIAPNKARIYPEHLGQFAPDSIAKFSNYTMFKKAFADADIPVLDFNVLFSQWKDTASYPIIPREGTHWSYYSTRLVFDTLHSFTEDLLQKDLRNYVWTSQNVTTKANKNDCDLILNFNLYWNPTHPDSFAYPIMTPGDTAGKARPKMVVIGDSFYWLLRAQGIDGQFFDPKSPFLYYFNTAYVPLATPVEMKDFDWMLSIDESDIVIFVCGESTMARFPYGFEKAIEKAY